jgi:hypothetical protein
VAGLRELGSDLAQRHALVRDGRPLAELGHGRLSRRNMGAIPRAMSIEN